MHEALEELMELARELQREMDALTETVNNTLQKIPDWAGWVRDRLMDGWTYLTEKANEFWEWFNDNVTFMPGRPGLLSETANSWQTDVGGPVSAKVGTVTAGQLAVDDHWEGSAANEYRQHLSPQGTAMEQIKSSLCDGIAQALDKTQSAIVIFWWALAAAFATLIAGVIGAAASAATVFGLPAAPFIAAGALGIALTAMFAAADHLRRECRSANTTMINRLTQLAAFPNGSWPRATLA